MDLFVIQIEDNGQPGQLNPVNSEEEAVDMLVKLAKENGVNVTREQLEEIHGFYVNLDDDTDVTGCWMIASES